MKIVNPSKMQIRKSNHPIRFIIFMFGISCLIAKEPDIHRTELIQLKLTKKQHNELTAMKIEFATGLLDSLALAVVTEAELAVIEERGYAVEKIMHRDCEVDLFKRALYGEAMTLDPIYHTYSEVVDELKTLVQKHPGLIKVEKIGRTSQGGRDIRAAKISDHVNTSEDEPAILFSGAIHSDEVAGVEICMALINHLLSRYGEDQQVTGWVDEYEIWLVPVINVDGHYVVTSGIDPRWRKNTRDNNSNGILYEKGDGIDLNRNFSYNWAHGGSSDSSSSRYRGEAPFSETECAAVRDLVLEQQFLLSVTYHSQGEVIYFPWDWRGRKAPDDKLLRRIANGLAGSIRTLKGDTTYAAHYGAGTVGQTYPWMYGAAGTLDFVVETGKGRHIFPPGDLKKIVESNLQGAFYMLEQMEGPGLIGRITDARTGKPLSAEVWLPDIDTDDVHRRSSNKEFGRYRRLLEPGRYRLIISKDGYQTLILKNIEIKKSGWTTLDIRLKKD
ncbi:carboxypeptidase regulatory-like domain-containing protein [candidate division KSB1 bacterium]|nr:carboxypeptidase regulatory-like domain-containing protein [candidate division KSB1 bacterium]